MGSRFTVQIAGDVAPYRTVCPLTTDILLGQQEAVTAYGNSAGLRVAKSGCLNSWAQSRSRDPIGEPSYQLNQFLLAGDLYSVSEH